MTGLEEWALKRIMGLLIAALLALGWAAAAEGEAAWAEPPVPEVADGVLPGQATAEKPLPISKLYFPDPAFRAVVRRDLDADGDGKLSPSEADAVAVIDVSGRGVASLEGVGFFKNLEYLYAADNHLAALYLEGNPRLAELDVSRNCLSELDLSANGELRRVSAPGNGLVRIDVADCAALQALDVSGNDLVKLDVSHNPGLSELDCSGNRLNALEVSKNPELRALAADGNGLASLNVSKCPLLEVLSVSGNGLARLSVQGNPGLTRLNVAHNALNALDVSANPALVELCCNGNALKALDIGACGQLTCLLCGDNQIKALNVLNNPLLTRLECQNNRLASMDFGALSGLSTLLCHGNDAGLLDAAGWSPALREIAVNEALRQVGADRVAWSDSAEVRLSLPLTATLMDGSRILYGGEYIFDNLNVSTRRADYPGLSDAEYANFRVVATSGMGVNALYRSSSPIRTLLQRNREADAAARAAGVRTVLNLSEDAGEYQRMGGYAQSYYSGLNIYARRISGTLTSSDSGRGYADGFRYMIAHPGPYLVHCAYGKDRTGFACAVLECLMGGTIGEVVADYMLTYCNYYGVRPGTEVYDYIADHSIVRQLRSTLKVGDVRDPAADLSGGAANYLRRIGMTVEEIEALKACLRGSY